MCTKSLNFRHCHHGNRSNAKMPKRILLTAEQNIFFSVFLCYPFVVYLIDIVQNTYGLTYIFIRYVREN